MDAEAVAAVITEALNGVVTSVGFTPGQVYVGREVEVLFCAAGDDFRRSLPALWDGIERHVSFGPEGALCIDLTVGAEGTASGQWLVTRAVIEGVPLAELAHDSGVGAPVEALEASALSSVPLDHALASVARFLRSAAPDATSESDRASRPSLD